MHDKTALSFSLMSVSCAPMPISSKDWKHLSVVITGSKFWRMKELKALTFLLSPWASRSNAYVLEAKLMRGDGLSFRLPLGPKSICGLRPFYRRVSLLRDESQHILVLLLGNFCCCFHFVSDGFFPCSRQVSVASRLAIASQK